MDAVEEGVANFNAGEFWHAHESWERRWLASEGGEKRFLQGLIQLAAAYHHVQRGTLRGATRLFEAALSKLEEFPNPYLRIDRSEVITASIVHRERITRGERIDASEIPKLRYNPLTSST